MSCSKKCPYTDKYCIHSLPICKAHEKEYEPLTVIRCKIEVGNKENKIHQTNADRIRSMSDAELAKLITSGEMCAICPFCQYYGTKDCYMENEGEHENCDKGIMKWLQSEAEE